MVSGTPMQSVTQAMDKYGQAYVQAAVSGTPGAAGFGPINPGTGATNLGKAEDTAHASGDVGVLNLGVRNDNALVNLTDANGDNAPIATNIKGALFSVPYYDSGVSNALNGLKAEDSAAASGDAGVAIFGVYNDGASFGSSVNDYVPLSVSNKGAASINVDLNYQTANSSGLLKPEDSAAGSGDALVGVAGVIQTTLATPAAAGDYAVLALGSYGQPLSSLIHDVNNSSAEQISIREDSPVTAGAAGLKVMFQTQDPLSVDNATGDAAHPKVDLAGRTITTLAPAGESWQACGTSTASTADVLLKAAVASNRIYVTNITCKNTSATVGTTIDFKDAAGGTMAVGGVSSVQATAAGTFTTTFPVPLRGTSNQNLNFAANVAVTSLTCCASGYVSVN